MIPILARKSTAHSAAWSTMWLLVNAILGMFFPEIIEKCCHFLLVTLVICLVQNMHLAIFVQGVARCASASRGFRITIETALANLLVLQRVWLVAVDASVRTAQVPRYVWIT